MKNITFIFLFLGTIGFAQNLGNPATIGQTNRNQKVGKGLQVEDTLLTKGKVIFSNLVTYGSADTFLAIKNGYLVRALPSGGDTTVIATLNYVNSLNGSNATKIDLNDSTSALNARINTKLNITDTVSQNLGIRTDYINRLILKANQTALNDSVTALRLLRKVDSSYLSLNAGLDSLVFTNIINGIKYRTSTLRTASGGSSSISGLTVATATNTIDNGAYSQEWQFNSLANGVGLKLSSNSTLASSNTQSIFEVANSGANANASQTTYGARFFNTKTGGSSTNIGAFFSASGASNNFAIEAQNRIKVSNSGSGIRDISFWSSGGENARIGTGYNGLVDDNIEINQLKNMSIVFKISNAEKMRINSAGLGIGTNTPSHPLTISTNVGGFGISLNSRILCDNSASSSQYTATSNGYSAQFGCATNANTAVINAGGNPILYVSNDNINVGIGVATPNASAKLEVVSTTQGFLPPRMTATQASAIASPAKSLIVYVTDTNGTFTSAGIWIFTTSWKLILAE